MSAEGRKEERKDPTFTAKCITADVISQAVQLVLDKESLVCQAENPRVRAKAIERGYKINKPKVSQS
jgi:hypothetical protein